MWIDSSGKNYTASQVCLALARGVGAVYTVQTLHATFGCGAIYRNGSIWFQRIE